MKCGWCGKFISYTDKDAVTYTNYGHAPAIDPPNPTDVCGKCWIACKTKEYYKNLEHVWRPVIKLFGGNINE